MFDNARTLTAAAALAGAMTFGGTAIAQTAMQSEDQMAQQPQMEVTDSDLEAFVEAQAAVAEVIQPYQERAAEVEDDAEMAQLEQEANADAMEALSESDLTPEKFNQIAMAIQTDPALQERLRGMMQR